MRFWALLCLTCGCDRVFLNGFTEHDAAMSDAAGDRDRDGFTDDLDLCPDLASPNQHDEDGDGIGDVCDNCPHLANTDQSNDDGDDLGDACEVVPNTPHDCIAHFDAFTTLPGLADSKGPWGIANGESLAQTSEATQDALLYIDAQAYDDPVILTKGTVRTLGVATDFNTAAIWGEATTAQSTPGSPSTGFVAEMTRSAQLQIDNSMPGLHSAVRDSGVPSNGMFVPFSPSQGALAVGSRFEIGVDMRAGTSVIAAVSMNGGAPARSTTTIPLLAPNRVALRTNRLAVEFDYVLVIESVTASACPPRR